MSRYSYGYPKYVSVAQRQAKAAQKIEQLKKKNPDINPVEIQGTKLANSWWGISWNKNLEGYADYSNRIGRGRSYVRHGAVLDLKIQPGKIISLVQGSTSTPYRVEITIDKLKSTVWATIVNECRGKIDSLGDLVDGKLPRAMGTLLTDSKNGIFPSPSEIKFQCSCPDSAYMCKHVAATLYGVGARLDNDPSLFFTLRGVKMETLVSQTLKDEADALLDRARSTTRSTTRSTGRSKDSKRIIQNADLSSAFGIEMEDISTPKPVPVKKRPSNSKAKPDKAGTVTGKAAAKTIHALPDDKITVPGTNGQATPTTKDPDYETVVKIVKRRRVKGIGFKEIKERTGIKDTKIRNILYRAKQNNEIQNISRGLYIKSPLA